MKKHHRTMLGAIALSASLALATSSAQAQSDPIKIGLITDLTGFLNNNGIAIRQAATLALEEVGYKVGNRSISLIIEDEASKPDQGIDKARKLVESDKAAIILGPFNGSTVVAVAGYINRAQVPNVVTWYSSASKDVLKMRWTWSPFGTISQLSTPTGAYAYDVLGKRTMTSMGMDYIAGREFIAGTENSFKERGGQVIQNQWIPLGTKDIAPYISALKKADFLAPWFAGVTVPAGLRQIKEFKVDMPVIMPQSGHAAHPDQIKEIGELGLGIITTDAYAWSIDTPENRDFVARYKKRWSVLPAGASYGGYFAMQIALEALKKAGGNTSREAIAKALDATRITGLLGDFSFGEARIGVGNYIVHEVVRGEGDQPYKTKVLARYRVQPVVSGDDVKFKAERVATFK